MEEAISGCACLGHRFPGRFTVLARDPLLEWALNPTKKLPVTPTTLTSLMHQQAYCAKSLITAACSIHSWASLLTMSLLAALVAPSSTVKAIRKGGSFCIDTSLTFPCPATIGCSIFKRVLPTSSDWQSRIMTIAYILLLGGLRDPLINNSNACSNICPVLFV